MITANPIPAQLQRLMNVVMDRATNPAGRSISGEIHEIAGHKVRCYSKWVGNTTKVSLNFDLDGKRIAFSKLCAHLKAWE